VSAVAPDSTPDVVASLQRFFGHRDFRAGQQELVDTVLAGRDLLAVMPTGSGKSLGFQLPAVLLPGVTLVVSPLISLMKDQVDELNRRGIRAAALHSQLSSEARQEAIRLSRLGEVRLLYVAPERFASDFFVRTLRDIPVARFIVDVAHCVSEWGHDFRPDYRRLRDAVRLCRGIDGRVRPPMAAFTATATPEVRDDIVDLLGLDDPRVVVAGFDRPNIALQVRPVSGDTEKHVLLPGLVRVGRSLVYAATRRKAEEMAGTLLQAGLQAAAYHAGLSDGERTRVQDAFAAGTLAIVCATNAFGMGIDRPDVETVVHVDIPGSIEAYYQEIGRAGRDGRNATAILLWNYADVKTREFLIERGRDDVDERGAAVDPEEAARRKQLEMKKLRRMIAYADTSACLRATILRYFGDPAARTCGACGNCARRATADESSLLLLRKILAGVVRAGERFGKRKIAAMLVGADDLPPALSALSTTGILRGEAPTRIERWIDAACGADLLTMSTDEYRTLRLTPLGRDVMSGRVTDVAITPPIAAREKSSGRRRQRADRTRREPGGGESIAAADPTIADALRAWRLDEARRRGIAPFIILHDRTLLAIAAARPRDTNALQDIPGIGPAKLAEYGDAIVSVVNSK
jgi:ATP-dependent DNA helicase RecQ